MQIYCLLTCLRVLFTVMHDMTSLTMHMTSILGWLK